MRCCALSLSLSLSVSLSPSLMSGAESSPHQGLRLAFMFQLPTTHGAVGLNAEGAFVSCFDKNGSVPPARGCKTARMALAMPGASLARALERTATSSYSVSRVTTSEGGRGWCARFPFTHLASSRPVSSGDHAGPSFTTVWQQLN